jgi:hypothetical protein
MEDGKNLETHTDDTMRTINGERKRAFKNSRPENDSERSQRTQCPSGAEIRETVMAK